MDGPASKVWENNAVCAHIAVDGHQDQLGVDSIEKDGAVLFVKTSASVRAE